MNEPAASTFPDKSHLVRWTDHDPELPLNWSTRTKVQYTVQYGITAFAAQLASAIMTPGDGNVAKYFDVTQTTSSLCTSLYVLGVAVGPMIFAPISEVYGRKIGILVPFAVSAVFSAWSATSNDMNLLLFTRFFAGFFASSPIVSTGGVLTDLWEPGQRAGALVLYSVFTAGGVNFAPLIGSSLVLSSDTSWRWPVWFTVALFVLVLVLDWTLLQETYGPELLRRRARTMRVATHQWAYHSPSEEVIMSFTEFLRSHMIRPFAMLLTPIVFFVALYASFVFGVLYIFVSSVPLVFRNARQWGSVVSSVPLLFYFLGMLLGGVINLVSNKRYTYILSRNGGKPVPEERFFATMIFEWLMPAGIFLFAWTAQVRCHYAWPILGLTISGCGFLVFQGCINYLVDAFSRYAASAVAAVTFGRSCFAATFPLFAHALVVRLHVDWGLTLVGFLALGLCPIPFIFHVWGSRIRKSNPYSAVVS